MPGGRRRDYSDSESSVSPPPRHRERRKSLSEQALGALGLGGAVAALTGKKEHDDHGRSKSRTRGRRDDSSSRERDPKNEYAQAAKAALTAGVVEAWRSRKEPGGWQARGKRIGTAAIGAAGVNKAIDKDDGKHSTRHIIEGALGGLAGSRLINGSRSRSRSRGAPSGGRGRDGRDDKGGNLGGIAAAGGLAALAGQALKNYRDRSRNRDDDRGRSRSRPRGGYVTDGYESDDYENHRPQRQRRKSFSDKMYDRMDRGLAKFGLGESENHRPEYYIDKNGKRQNINNQELEPRPRGGGLFDNDNKGHGSDTDEYSSDEEKKKEKQLFRKEFITAGLASVATIHAAHNVFQSMEKREKRHTAVMEGKMTPEEARKLKSKALVQDVASVGIAALGIKGAMSEWTEMKEKRDEYKEHHKRLLEKQEHRRQKIANGEWDPRERRAIKNKRSEPDMRQSYDDGYYSPRYADGNPYATGGMPPPPMGQRY